MSRTSPFASIAYNLATLYKAQYRWLKAKPLYERSLAITEKALGPDHAKVAEILNSLALLNHTLSNYDDAERLFKRLLAIDEKTLGPDHPYVLKDLDNLASLYNAQGREAEAQQLAERVQAIRKRATATAPSRLAKKQRSREANEAAAHMLRCLDKQAKECTIAGMMLLALKNVNISVRKKPDGSVNIKIVTGRPTNYGPIVRLLNEGCDGGHAQGCNVLAELYREGRGVSKDMDKAKKFHRLSCELGDQTGCRALNQ